MIYITGDIHGDFYDLKKRVESNNITKDDTLIILGDVAVNYHLNNNDLVLKKKINDLGPQIFCIRGNHEARPERISTYQKKEWHGADVYFEREFPNIILGIDGNSYDIEGKSFLVLGGAYSVDKYFRAFRFFTIHNLPFFNKYFVKITKLLSSKKIDKEDKRSVDIFLDGLDYGLVKWFNDEQLTGEEKDTILNQIKGHKYDVVLSHTCPFDFQPTEVFLRGLNQELVDNSQEIWLQRVSENIEYNKWFAGHFHVNKKVNDRFSFLYRDVEKI